MNFYFLRELFNHRAPLFFVPLRSRPDKCYSSLETTCMFVMYVQEFDIEENRDPS